ncbi:Tetratricopeptide repeat protein [Operophtera brumata]|uniref:Tetratricopeptide repeat protein n=1 Tax=Operophtera brumata TaxID=104452 RepID=A0A0L7KJV2_OPEBR|nr:Tetratricopeptide repeat protein [Operophtera brumata]
MSARYRFILNSLSRFAFNFRSIPRSLIVTHRNTGAVPCMLGFSLFTWLGFNTSDNNLTAEDELINTIKHCVIFIQRLDYDKAEQLLHVALRQAQQLHHELGITYIYDLMANLALEREQLDKAKRLFVAVTQRIMADGAKEDDPRVVHISAKLARISHLQKEYTTAQLGFDWCLDQLKAITEKDPSSMEHKKLLALTEDWYGRLFLDCQQYQRGIILMVSALEKMKEVSDIEQEHIVFQLNDIGAVYDELDKPDESISYFKEAILLGKSMKMDEIGTTYVNLGRAYIKKKMIEEARKSCGYAWKLGVLAKDKDVKHEAELCLKQIKNLS